MVRIAPTLYDLKKLFAASFDARFLVIAASPQISGDPMVSLETGHVRAFALRREATYIGPVRATGLWR